MKIIDGRKIKNDILKRLKKDIGGLSFKPIFCDVLVGKDKASIQYVNIKRQNAESVGIIFKEANYPANIKTDFLIKKIKALNKIPNMCGIIVQLPLPKNIDREKVLNAIEPRLDVDCLGKNVYRGNSSVSSPVALACVELLDSLKISFKNKKIVVLGQGDLVGKPVSAILESRGIKPIKITQKSKNKKKIIKNADIIISGIGKSGYLTGDMVKRGVIIIDAGTSESKGSIAGDANFKSVKNKVSFISPVPGGVGPVTVATLLKNVFKVAKKQHG